MAGKIVIKGARVHNLKNVDLEIPRDQLVVITGVSGSGKSSLAFDTLYAEGQRRYLESLAVDARQLLQQMEKPDVDQIDGLSPTIAIQQKSGVANPRSTVGTMTDVYDYLRLLFARVGQPTCVDCGREIKAYTIEQAVDELRALPAQARLLILAPISRQGDIHSRLRDLARQGFTRIRIDGVVRELSDESTAAIEPAGEIELVVDRLGLREGIERRLADSVETASRWGDGVIHVHVMGDDTAAAHDLRFNRRLACVHCGAAVPEITPSLFSFNSPQGACPACNGLGLIAKGGKRSKKSSGGEGTAICPICGGSRLRKESLAVKVGGHNIAEVAGLSLAATSIFLAGCEFADRQRVVGRKIIDEITDRLKALTQLGLGYLSLDRSSVTLSGGEAQRVRLATQIGSRLAGVLYILDEPSIGLHQKDNAELISLLKQLRDAGNSVVVVEHDQETILAADYLVDMGPGAGAQGGEVVAHGSPQTVLREPRSLTGGYLSGALKIPLPSHRRAASGAVLEIKDAHARNLKNITVKIPIGALTCVTGVSGAGKSTLVMEILFNGVAQRLQRSNGTDGGAEITGWQHFDRVVGVDQGPIGRTPRSNPATYTGLYDHLRELFAQVPDARVRGYQAERFSFNAAGGRCEACGGDGVVRVEMYFLPELFVTCDVCKGRRYNRETLEIKFKGYSIADILDLSVTQAIELLNTIGPIHDRLRTLRDVGLGYLKLGQSASTLSGGEAQRVKLARELARKSTGRSLYILDEPTTGLHFDDVQKLLDLLERLVDQGNTMIVIEHNLDVIKCADHVIDLGPEGGSNGGEIVAQGTPEEVAESPASFTGQYLAKALALTSSE
jgi:excinuclease ABC subunit A